MRTARCRYGDASNMKQNICQAASHATMKTNISKFLILLFVALLMEGCSTPGQRAISTSEDNRIRTLTEDRSTWVDSPFRTSPR